MTSKWQIVTALILLTAPTAVGQQQTGVNARDIEATVRHAVGWHQVWHSRQPPESVPATKQPVRAVRYESLWAISVPALKLLITTTVTPSGSPGHLLGVDESEYYAGSTESAIRYYHSIHFANAPCSPGVSIASGGRATAEPGNTLPLARPCMEREKVEPIAVHDLQCSLVSLYADEIRRAPKDSDPEGVASLVRSWVMQYYSGASGSMTIPRYLKGDPRVYVYLRVSQQATGILLVSRDPDGQFAATRLLERRESVDRYRAIINSLPHTDISF
jgi:hypothetical protein